MDGMALAVVGEPCADRSVVDDDRLQFEGGVGHVFENEGIHLVRESAHDACVRVCVCVCVCVCVAYCLHFGLTLATIVLMFFICKYDDCLCDDKNHQYGQNQQKNTLC